MLGQPVYFLTPDVVGVHLTGALARRRHRDRPRAARSRRCCARRRSSASSSSSSARARRRCRVVDRATIANMAPEYGATMGFFPIDAESCRLPARDRPQRRAGRRLPRTTSRRRACSGIPRGARSTTRTTLELDLATVVPSVAGPEASAGPHRAAGPEAASSASVLASRSPKTASARTAGDLGADGSRRPSAATSASAGGGSQDARFSVDRGAAQDTNRVDRDGDGRTTGRRLDRIEDRRRRLPPAVDIGHGAVLIAAITSCTNTSNPSVMLAAGLLAKKAVERGLKVSPR